MVQRYSLCHHDSFARPTRTKQTVLRDQPYHNNVKKERYGQRVTTRTVLLLVILGRHEDIENLVRRAEKELECEKNEKKGNEIPCRQESTRVDWS